MPEFRWSQLDWWQIAAILGLGVLSIAMLVSSSLGSSDHYVQNQLLFWAAGLIVLIALSLIPLPQLIRLSPIVYAGLIALLIALAIAGQATRGSVSWLYIGPFGLQPSELIKPVNILVMAFVYQQLQQRSWPNWRIALATLTVPLAPIIITLMQPDFGTAAIMMVGAAAVMWMIVINKKLLAVAAIIAAVVGITSWQLLAPYQQQRVFTFLNPAADPLGSGYNVLQSVIAVQSGGLLGQGWGQGTQSHLNFLPEHHTDFIFASLSEELGFLAGATVIGLFLVLLWRGSALVWSSQHAPTMIVVVGILCMILAQAAINIAMNIGLAPVTGIPLPFVSYGGSSLISSAIGIAVLQSVYRQKRKESQS